MDYEASQQYGHRRLHIPIRDTRGVLILPEEAVRKTPMPWVWYAPSFFQRLPKDLHTWYLQPLLRAGCAVAGVDVGESMGNPAGRERFCAFYEALVGRFSLSPRPVLLPQSRGGLMHYNWAVENPEKVGAIAGIYTVCDLRSYPGLERAATAYGFSAERMERELPRHNPVDRLQPLAAARVPLFHIHGDADEVVPLESNAGKLVERYRCLGGPAQLKIIPGKGHEEVDAFFRDADFLAFLQRAAGVE